MSETILAGLDDRELAQRCFEDSTDAVVVTDVQGRIQRANPAWLALHGYRLEQVVGQSTRLVRSEASTNELYQEMWRDIRDPAKGRWTGEIVNRRSDGTEIPLLLTITPIRGPAGVIGYMGIGLDIHERKELDELKRLYDLLVLHDLRSPLGSIITALDYLVGGHLGPLAPHQGELLARARSQARRMLAMIGSSLDIEKLRRRKLSVDTDEVDLASVLREVCDEYAEMARRRQVSLMLEVRARRESSGAAAGKVLWPLDPIHFQRCVDNLVKNALEACPMRGRVEVRVESDERGARVRVHNEGAPIPANVRATLFHPFGTYGKRGTGLGLYGVRLLVEAMGGQVQYDTGEGGTAFELLFEAATDGRPASRDRGPGSEPGPQLERTGTGN